MHVYNMLILLKFLLTVSIKAVEHQQKELLSMALWFLPLVMVQ